jgi:3-oxoacyl-[acyl-carrier protein] reductase
MNAFIAGSTKGIGNQIGMDLLNKDYFVYFNGHSLESTNQLKLNLQNYPNSISNNKYNIIWYDLSSIENSINLANEFIARNIKLDVLVWNVGLTDRTRFGNINSKEWNRVFEANLSSPFFFIQDMKNNINPGGKIILISSILGIIPDSVSLSYGVSKAAINMLIPYLAKELSDKKITVNAIAPGFIDTDWHKGKNKKQIERIKNKSLAKRFGTVEEISRVAMSIIDNDYINGQIIRCDGGYGL